MRAASGVRTKGLLLLALAITVVTAIKLVRGSEPDMPARGMFLTGHRVVTGKVVDRDNVPIAGAKVSIGMVYAELGDADERDFRRSVISDAKGEFRFDNVADHRGRGPMQMLIGADEPFRGRAMPVQIPDAGPITLVIRGASRLTGRVTQGGVPVAAGTVVAVGWPEFYATETDARGEFVMPRLPIGASVDLRVVPNGRETRIYDSTVDLLEGGDRVDVDLPAGTSTLFVYGPDQAGLFLIAGTVTATNLEQVSTAFWRATQGFHLIQGGAPAKFEELYLGDYSLCAVGPLSAKKLRDDVSAICTPIHIDGPVQTVGVAIPAPR